MVAMETGRDPIRLLRFLSPHCEAAMLTGWRDAKIHPSMCDVIFIPRKQEVLVYQNKVPKQSENLK